LSEEKSGKRTQHYVEALNTFEIKQTFSNIEDEHLSTTAATASVIARVND
jgi:hypothetical protein